MAGGMRSVDLSNPEIQQAWQEVRNDASDSNWFVSIVVEKENSSSFFLLLLFRLGF